MKIIGFDHNQATVELEASDCFLLAEACEKLYNSESSAARIMLADALAAAFTAAGMAAAAEFHGATDPGWSLEAVRANCLPRDDGQKPSAPTA